MRHGPLYVEATSENATLVLLLFLPPPASCFHADVCPNGPRSPGLSLVTSVEDHDLKAMPRQQPGKVAGGLVMRKALGVGVM